MDYYKTYRFGKAKQNPQSLVKTYIDIVYQEKDDAKFLGARWDADVKKWYITTNNKNEFYDNLLKVGIKDGKRYLMTDEEFNNINNKIL